LADLEVTSITVDPVDPSTVFVGTLGDGVYRSRDGGLTWQHVLSTYCCPNFLDVAVDPGNHLRVLAPTYLTHAYASFDGGDRWVHLFHGLEWDLTSVEFDPSSRDTIYVSNVDSTSVQRSHRSANGLYWVGASQGMHQHDVLDLSLDVLDPDIVYAATIEDGVYKTVDGAGSWVPASTGLTDFDMTVVRSSPLVAGLVLVGTTTAGLFLSRDGAASWEATPLAGIVNAITFHPTDPGTVLAGTPRGIYRSDDGGLSWVRVLGSA
jgi:photosystem II stability/assembly factor-like uncharacterized protein